MLTVEFTVLGIPCLGLNGGPTFKHSEAFSFQIATDNHAAEWARTMTRTDCLPQWPEVGLWAVPPSGVLQSEVVVYRMAESLLAAQIALSCLNRCVSKQELNLLKFSAR